LCGHIETGTLTVPEVVDVKPEIMRMVVVLPAPLGPKKQHISPFYIE
jgi:hypothetical protein